ncbi:DUF3828 domain-containing protein [Commensalibacter nepenthis]|uniref:DUF3828 domain-containing protein n=1 Tax=Commensalibacter nepenthis TaxID=3043872 RepID=A0ABT6Q773_9PROT|nr:DUF3828 domain-containing protein [Commensalibacter sp. TBRC 10068]MDI2112729.1 DUF3828 domain-containing protein [Commensalibacter sp. TBRC 10068]
MLINHFNLMKTYCGITALIGTLFLFQTHAYAQSSPTEIIKQIYSFYQPSPDSESNDIGFDRTDFKNKQFFSPDFLKVIKEDEKLTSAQGDGSVMDYDFICNCQDTMDGLIVRNIEILQETAHTARVKVSFDFVMNGSDTFQKDDVFTTDRPGQQHTYFNLINSNNRWFIDDVTDEKNIGIKKTWKEELRKYYHSSIQ